MLNNTNNNFNNKRINMNKLMNAHSSCKNYSKTDIKYWLNKDNDENHALKKSDIDSLLDIEDTADHLVADINDFPEFKNFLTKRTVAILAYAFSGFHDTRVVYQVLMHKLAQHYEDPYFYKDKFELD